MSRDADGNFRVKCTLCERTFKVYPPSLEYVKIIPMPCPRGDSIVVVRNCLTCDTQNTIIWDLEHEFG
jgi:hypothetical protein